MRGICGSCPAPQDTTWIQLSHHRRTSLSSKTFRVVHAGSSRVSGLMSHNTETDSSSHPHSMSAKLLAGESTDVRVTANRWPAFMLPDPAKYVPGTDVDLCRGPVPVRLSGFLASSPMLRPRISSMFISRHFGIYTRLHRL